MTEHQSLTEGKFIPQSPVMYAVTEDLTGYLQPCVQIVIGWAPHPTEPDVLVAVVTDPTDGIAYRANPEIGKAIVHLFASREEAYELRGHLAGMRAGKL